MHPPHSADLAVVDEDPIALHRPLHGDEGVRRHLVAQAAATAVDHAANLGPEPVEVVNWGGGGSCFQLAVRFSQSLFMVSSFTAPPPASSIAQRLFAGEQNDRSHRTSPENV